MNHPFIIKAFENAYKRVQNESTQDEGTQIHNEENKYNIYKEFNIETEPKVYIICKREGIFYKDTYCVLIGTKKYIDIAIQKAHETVEEAKQETGFYMGDHNDLLDTPFDTWCGGKCMCNNINQCSENTEIKCCSHWTFIEFNSNDELDMYLRNIKPGYYYNYDIEYM